MLTEFQAKKLKHMFSLFDNDKDGYLTEEDYVRIGDNFARLYDYPLGSPAHMTLQKEFAVFWQGIERLASGSTPGKVSSDAFLAGQDLWLSDREGFNASTEALVKMTLEIADRDGDGKLAQQEFLFNLLASNVNLSDAVESFHHIDQDGDGYVTKEEMARSLVEVYYSDDPHAAGNWLLGPVR